MAFFREVVKDDYGRPIVGVLVYVLNRDGSLAILNDGEANPITTDQLGGFSFNAPDAVYSLEYRFAGVTKRVDNVIVGSPPDFVGAPGPSNNTRATLADLKAAAITDKTSLYDGSLWTWTEGNFTGQADDINVVKADSTPLYAGAWVRQDAQGVQFAAPVAGAIRRSVSATLSDHEISPETFGAIGNGIADDTAQLAAALTSGFSVKLTTGKTYLVKRKIELTVPGITISGGGKIRVALDYDRTSDVDEGGWHMRLFFVLAANITFSGLTMDATGVDLTEAGIENGFVWSRAAYTTVTGCQFIGMSKGTCVWSLGDAPYLSVTGCTSTNCSGLVFGRGRNGIANDNIVINATDAAIAINAQVCTGWVIADNTINNEALAIIPAMIAVEEGASGWIITGNNLYGANGGGINCINLLDDTSVKGGIVANNYISAATFDGERPVTTNPAALLSVTASYRDVLISGNIIVGVPEGPSNSRAVVIPASGTVFENNVIDASMATGIDAIIDIIASNAGIVIRDNRVTGFAMARQFLINAGNYGDEPVRFIGGDFLVGTTAIDAELAWSSIMGLKLYIDNLKRVKDIAIPVQATSAIGDRATFLNLDCVYLPHKIDFFTEMACAFTTSTPGQTPVTPGALPWQNGDYFRNVDPAAQGALHIVRVAGGSEPDRWKRFGGPVT